MRFRGRRGEGAEVMSLCGLENGRLRGYELWGVRDEVMRLGGKSVMRLCGLGDGTLRVMRLGGV